MNNADALHRTLQGRCDDRGYVRATLDDLAIDTGLSRSTIKRLLGDLVTAGLIRRRSKDGAGGGVLIRLETGSPTGSEPVQKPVQNEPVHHVVKNQTPSPEGALGGLVGPTGSTSSTGSSPPPARPVAYRPVRHDETTPGNAEFAYVGNDHELKWRRVSATIWEAPNGDWVSVRSMTLSLRMRLRVNENEDGTTNLEAIRAIRGIVE